MSSADAGLRSRDILDVIAPRAGPETLGWIDAALAAAVALATSALLVFNGQRTFEFYDMSAFMDAGYRIATGQRIYVDFFYNAGPVHPWLLALAFSILGFDKHAVLGLVVFGNVLFVAGSYLLARRYLTAAEAAFGAVVASLAFYGTVAHPWYDQHAYLFLLGALVAIELGLPIRGRARPVAIGFAAGALAALALFTKANIGGAAGLLLPAVLLAAGLGASSLAGFACGALTCAGLVLAALAAPAQLVHQTLRVYAPQGRFHNMRRLHDAVLEQPFIVVLGAIGILAAIGGVRFVREQARLFTIAFGLTMLSIFAAWTGSMILTGNIALLGIECIYVMAIARALPDGAPGSRARRLRVGAVIVAVTVQIGALEIAALRTKELESWAWRPYGWKGDYVLKTPALRGWHAARHFGEGFDEAVAYIEEHVPRGDTLLAFPDASVVSMITRRKSYRPVPFVFDADGLLKGSLRTTFREHFLAEPPAWILFHENAGEVPIMNPQNILKSLDLQTFLDERYVVEHRFPGFALLRLRPAKGSDQ